MLTLRLLGRDEGDVLAVEQHPAGVGLLEARDHPQGGGLAAAPTGRASRRTRPRGNLEADVVDRAHLAELLHQPLDDDHRFAHRSPSTTIANRSFTLVPVGPVTSASSSAVSATWERCSSSAERRSIPAAAARSIVRPSTIAPACSGAAVGAVGVEEDGGHRGALELERGGDRRLLVRAALAEAALAGEGHRALAAAAEHRGPAGERRAAVAALAGEVGQQPADLARLALERGRDHHRSQLERQRLVRHRLAGGRPGDQEDGLDRRPRSGPATRRRPTAGGRGSRPGRAPRGRGRRGSRSRRRRARCRRPRDR